MSNDGEHGPPEFGDSEGLLISEFVEIKACFGFGGTIGFGLMGGFIGLTSFTDSFFSTVCCALLADMMMLGSVPVFHHHIGFDISMLRVT